MERGRWRVSGCAAVLCCVGATSCTTGHPQARATASVPPPTSAVSTPTTSVSWPTVVVAKPYSYSNPAVGPKLAFGIAIPATDIGSRSDEVGGVIYGLADQGDLASVNYPAITHDSGHTWSIDGPIFHIAAADGAAAVSTIASVSATTAYSWGGGGHYIRFTTDGGRQWWGAFFEDSVDRVSFGNGSITATLYSEGSNEPTYVSGDGGRNWRLQSQKPS